MRTEYEINTPAPTGPIRVFTDWEGDVATYIVTIKDANGVFYVLHEGRVRFNAPQSVAPDR